MQIALVTGSAHADAAARADAPLVTALTAHGAHVGRPRWDDAEVDWGRFDVAVVRTPWDYPPRREAFVAWASATAEETPLWNPADVLRWNTHKSYLLELEERGAPVVPTAWLARGDAADLGELARARGWDRVVVKPAVGAGSQGLHRSAPLAGPDALTAAQAHLDGLVGDGDAMVQPYLPGVEVEGEVSVVLIDGAVSHVVRKVPASGDFRVQHHLGGDYRRVDPAREGDEPAALARWIVEATGHEFLYSRVDLLRDEVGTWQLAELEATEPDLYLGTVPEAADVLAAAIMDRAGR